MSHHQTVRSHNKPHAKFSVEEDQILRELVAQHGEKNWSVVASHMPDRSPRQCRERWTNYLSPKLNNNEWLPEEDSVLLARYEEFGSRWVLISKYLEGRTDQMVKNRYFVIYRKSLRESSRKTNGTKTKTQTRKSLKNGRNTRSQTIEEPQTLIMQNEFIEIESQKNGIDSNGISSASSQSSISSPSQDAMIKTPNNSCELCESSADVSDAKCEAYNNDSILDESLKFLQMVTDNEWDTFGSHMFCDVFLY
ncbi:Myb-like DNA-binding domain containing protein [Tritrichomonas foetus]|uniref:Myb-like DNA-binding domain containing protein n=1 Tax=Tritrichomonas foetus TaxID=1144522 RepID=A0A1J4L6D3_9EUKA|nr:Myb-like DNA-binding domain containing protein [Tritrichomonas foetus]|eukprot:OHT17572.1 Myb-like DNA-binding domain containing protein [Tritrichomonas foetus]